MKAQFYRILFAICLLAPTGWAFAQLEEELTKLWFVEENADRLVVAQANGEREDAVRFLWERDDAHGYTMMALSRDGIFPSAKVFDVMRIALGGYLDVQIKFGSRGVKAQTESETLAVEMESMMNALLATTQIAPPNFTFSVSMKEALRRLTRIDWSNTAHALEGNPEEDKYIAIYKFVRVQREALEKAIEQDISPYREMWLGREHVFVSNVSDATVCGTVFDEDKYLCALDLQVNEVYVDDPQPGLSLKLPDESEILRTFIPEVPKDEGKTVRVRKRDRWLKDELGRLNERMDKIDNTKEVLAIRDRIDVIEDRLTNMEGELEDVRTRSTYDNPIENLSLLTGKNITIRFRNGSTQVAPAYMVLLNEVFEQLARSPRQRILVTGYSDKSGSSVNNLRLSELRAKVVRSHLLERGITPDRIMVNFYGDSKSSKINPTERRVEIEWLGS